MSAQTVYVAYKKFVPLKYLKSKFLYEIIPMLYYAISKKINEIELVKQILVICIHTNTRYLEEIVTYNPFNKLHIHKKYFNLKFNFIKEWWKSNDTPYTFNKELISLFNHDPYYRKFKNKKKIIVFLKNIGFSRFFLFIKKHKTRRLEFYNSSELNKNLVYSNELDYILQHNQLQSIDKML